MEEEITRTIHYSIRCTLSILAVLLVALAAGAAGAELRTYVKEYSYQASKADGKESSQTIGMEPNMTRAYVYRGLANYNLGKYDQAIEDYNTAIKRDPKQAGAHYNLARIYSLEDNHEKALYDLEAAIKIDQSFKNLAKKENDFDRIRERPDFIKLISP